MSWKIFLRRTNHRKNIMRKSQWRNSFSNNFFR